LEKEEAQSVAVWPNAGDTTVKAVVWKSRSWMVVQRKFMDGRRILNRFDPSWEESCSDRALEMMRRASNGLGWGSKSVNFAPTNGGRAKIFREWKTVAVGAMSRALILAVESAALKASAEGPGKLKVAWRMSTKAI
jgi:hypothetical protein